MLIGQMTAKDGRKMLVVGLQEENLAGLRNDKPIYKTLDGTPDPTGETEPGPVIEGLEGWTLVILGPEDMARFIARYGAEDA